MNAKTICFGSHTLGDFSRQGRWWITYVPNTDKSMTAPLWYYHCWWMGVPSALLVSRLRGDPEGRHTSLALECRWWGPRSRAAAGAADIRVLMAGGRSFWPSLSLRQWLSSIRLQRSGPAHDTHFYIAAGPTGERRAVIRLDSISAAEMETWSSELFNRSSTLLWRTELNGIVYLFDFPILILYSILFHYIILFL